MKTLSERLNFKTGEYLGNTDAITISNEDALHRPATIIKELCAVSGLLLSDIEYYDFDSACIMLEDWAKGGIYEDEPIFTIWID